MKLKTKLKTVVVVMNFDGTVGKTTVTDQQIAPRLYDGASPLKKFRIESLNSGGHEGDGTKEVDASKLNAIAVAILTARGNVLIDIGASNVVDTMSRLQRLEGFSKRITHWLIPATPDLKVHEGTLATVQFLLSLGVDSGAITVLPNRINERTFKTDFSNLRNALKQKGVRCCDIGIPENEVFNFAGDRTIKEIVEDRTDYDKLLSELTDEQLEAGAGDDYATRVLTQNMAFAVDREMDDAFRWIFSDWRVEA
jgi:hypothetical protein